MYIAEIDQEISVVKSNVHICNQDVQVLCKTMKLMQEYIVTLRLGGGCGGMFENIIVKMFPEDGKLQPLLSFFFGNFM